MITMVLGGLWHGASVDLRRCGAPCTALPGVYHALARASRPVAVDGTHEAGRSVGGTAVVFYTCHLLGWLFFRAQDPATTMAYLTRARSAIRDPRPAVVPVMALWSLRCRSIVR